MRKRENPGVKGEYFRTKKGEFKAIFFHFLS